MSESNETIIHINWEGYFLYKNLKNLKDKLNGQAGLYQVYGTYPPHNNQSLLYIGKSENLFHRLEDHTWLSGIDWKKQISDSDNIQIYFGFLKMKPKPKNYPELICKSESLLIFSHKPILNQQEKNHKMEFGPPENPIRIFNWGNYKFLMPEVSTLRWAGQHWDVEEFNYIGETLLS